MSKTGLEIAVGVLALQGAFAEHLQLLRKAASCLHKTSGSNDNVQWTFTEIRTPVQLEKCDALIFPGGESTTMSLVAARSGLLEPLRQFVKADCKPTWGTCAGLILLAEAANRTKKGGQELIGGLDVRVNRNHFGRQSESFETSLNLPFIQREGLEDYPFKAIFIRAPIVEKFLDHGEGEQTEEAQVEDTVVAPSRRKGSTALHSSMNDSVTVLARLPRSNTEVESHERKYFEDCAGDVIAVQQNNVVGTSFHPELTGDSRMHLWWLSIVMDAVKARRQSALSVN